MRWWLIGLAVILLLPTNAAATEVTASSVFFPEAASHTSDLVAIDYRATQVARLALTATDADFELDTSRQAVAGEVGFGTEEPTTERFSRSRVVMDGASNDNAGLFAAADQANAQLVGTGLRSEASALGCLEQPLYFANSRQPLCPRVSDALYGAVSTPAELVINGTFTFAIWSWSGSISSATGTEEYWTGERATDPVGLPLAGQRELRHLVVHVRNGELRLSPPAEQPLTLFGGPARISSAGPASLTGGVYDVIEGSTVIDVSPTPNGISLQVVDGTVIGAPPAEDGARHLWLWIVPLTAVGGLLLLVHRVKSRLALARENFGLGNFHAAFRHSHAAMRAPWLRREAGVLATISLLRAGDVDDAEQFLRTMPRWGPEPAAMSYLNAFVLATHGRLEEGRVALLECLTRDPRYHQEAMSNPILRALLAGTPDEGGYT